GKTAIFISHRLASTRFSDRIILLDHGRIQEEGTHEELMELGGAYAHMYQVQSSYYEKEAGAGNLREAAMEYELGT
ncbi:MAG: ABC transporter ATP-binding protein, partial [Acetatifactor sp.]|nr:ABC transporter ATP-binding protein [Acetatifactor sp.]